IVEAVILPTIPSELRDTDPVMHVNPTGRFVTGGPMGDAGLTGRKIIVDSYGGMARHGGGAFSGKDPTKVDRSAAYAARWVAKNVVAARLADRVCIAVAHGNKIRRARRFEFEVPYRIGLARPISFSVASFGTGRIDDTSIGALIDRHFDLRPASIIAALDLSPPLDQQKGAYGHFGRPDLDLPWERTDKAAILAADAGLRETERLSAARPPGPPWGRPSIPRSRRRSGRSRPPSSPSTRDCARSTTTPSTCSGPGRPTMRKGSGSGSFGR